MCLPGGAVETVVVKRLSYFRGKKCLLEGDVGKVVAKCSRSFRGKAVGTVAAKPLNFLQKRMLATVVLEIVFAGQLELLEIVFAGQSEYIS